jgi:hypothetical protein
VPQNLIASGMLSDDNRTIDQRTMLGVLLNDPIIDKKINEKSFLAVVSKTKEPRIYVGF